METADVERTVGKLEGRMDGVEQRLERMEEKMDELLSTVHAARGGWRLLIALGTISGATNAGNPVKIGGAFNTTQPTVTTGQTIDAQMTSRGAQIVATGADTFNVTINAAIAAGSNTIGNVNAIQSGTWTVQQGGSPWSQNVSQWGGSATTLGQKTSANSLPVTIASDQSAITVIGRPNVLNANSVTGTTAVPLFGSSKTQILSINVVNVGAVLAAGTVTLTIKDGSGNTVFAIFVPTATSTAFQPFTVADFQMVNFPLNNAGSNVTAVLSANLTSGSIYICTAMM